MRDRKSDRTYRNMSRCPICRDIRCRDIRFQLYQVWWWSIKNSAKKGLETTEYDRREKKREETLVMYISRPSDDLKIYGCSTYCRFPVPVIWIISNARKNHQVPIWLKFCTVQAQSRPIYGNNCYHICFFLIRAPFFPCIIKYGNSTSVL